MRCTDALKRLNEELKCEVNKSQLLYYDEKGVVSPGRDKYLRRDYTESDYARLKWAIQLSKVYVSIPIIKEILDLNQDTMELTARALEEKSKSVWLTAADMKDKIAKIRRQ